MKLAEFVFVDVSCILIFFVGLICINYAALPYVDEVLENQFAENISFKVRILSKIAVILFSICFSTFGAIKFFQIDWRAMTIFGHTLWSSGIGFFAFSVFLAMRETGQLNRGQ